jgi:sugar phosphate isomerase/epimerase
MNQTIQAASACLPGRPLQRAAQQLADGVTEPAWGRLGIDHVQLCPQHPGQITDEIVEAVQAILPTTRLRLHANVFVEERRWMYDASTLEHEGHRRYFGRLAEISQRIDAPAYSLHAGYVHQASRERMRDNVLRVQELFGDIPVAVEPLYPLSERDRRSGKAEQLLSTWADLEWLMQSELPIALDLSHVQIIATAEGRQDDLLRDLLRHPRLLELHVSDNDGRHDAHTQCAPEVCWWMPLLAEATLPEACVVFSEGSVDKTPSREKQETKHG